MKMKNTKARKRSLNCLDCRNVPFGTSKYDQCDVCGGNGKSCVDCRGVVKGNFVYNRCDECTSPAEVRVYCVFCNIYMRSSIDRRENDNWRASIVAMSRSALTLTIVVTYVVVTEGIKLFF